MRPYSLLVTLVVFAGIALLSGCAEEPAPVQNAAKPAVKSVTPPKAKEAEAPPVEVKFVYQVEGRRDPFVPLIATKKTAEFFENPLEAFDVPQFKVKAVIVGMGETRAMVNAPDGNAFILKVGMRLGKANGVIKEINRERILVEEQYQDLTGKTRRTMQELKVPVQEGV